MKKGEKKTKLLLENVNQVLFNTSPRTMRHLHTHIQRYSSGPNPQKPVFFVGMSHYKYG